MNFQKKIYTGIGIVIAAVLIYVFSDIFTYIILAWVLSMAGRPLMNFFGRMLSFKKFRPGDGLLSGMTMISFIVIGYFFIRMVVPPVLQQAESLGHIDYKNVLLGLKEPMKDANDWLKNNGVDGFDKYFAEEETTEIALEKVEEDKTIEMIHVNLDSMLLDSGDSTTRTHIVLDLHLPSNPIEKPVVVPVKSVSENLQEKIFTILNPAQIPQLFASLMGVLGNLFIGALSVFFISFFFLKERELFVKSVKIITPRGEEDRIESVMESITTLLSRYFIGILIQISIVGAYISIVLSLLGVENAILIGVFAGLINVIPFLGPLLGAVFAMIILIVSNLDVNFYEVTFPLLLKVLTVFASIQLIDNFILQPIIFGKSVKAHPLEIFLCILIGAKLGGIMGMVVAIPTYTILRVISKEFLSKYKIIESLTKNMN